MNNLGSVVHRLCLLLQRETHPDDPRWADIQAILKAIDRGRDINLDLLPLRIGENGSDQRLNVHHLVKNAEEILEPLIPNHVDLNPVLAPDLKSIQATYSRLGQSLHERRTSHAQGGHHHPGMSESKSHSH